MTDEAQPADDGFGALIEKVQRERGFACASYKQSCLRRRVNTRMRLRGVPTFSAYSAILDRDSREFDKLMDALTINVTRFFRNAAIWESIAEQVVGPVWRSDLEDIRVWSAGCATGEEAYSMAILFHRVAATSGMLGQIERVRVLGTDVDPRAIEFAREADFGAASLAEIPAELRTRYFPEHPPFMPATGVRRMVHFDVADLLAGGYPSEPQDVIICRNVLIYFDRSVQEQVLESFRDALRPGGYLILGKVESLLGATRQHFEPIVQRARIFRRVR
jgi:chemotaxis methyl-accepting protein methylase